MNRSILTGEHITKKYGNTVVLRDVSIHIEQAAIYGLIGKNGSGKTTLLRILAKQIPNYKGSVKLKSENIRVSAVINSPALFLNMSAIQNLKTHSFLLDKHNQEDIQKVMQIVGLENTGNKKVRDFSLGMTQRLKLAQALLENPDILILDEPINGLDPDGISDLRNLIIKLNKEQDMTIIISSHILSELENTATTIGILSDGKIAFQSSKQELASSGKSLEEVYMHYTKGGLQQ